jgi:hypothetical protein
MNDDELVEKMARAMSDTEWMQSRGVGTNPDNQPGTLLLSMARAALQVVKEAGWRPPQKPKLLADVS